MMSKIVFYSWQSDSPAKINKYFIEDALQAAIKRLSSDVELEEAERESDVVLDKDTKNIGGSPAIVDTILDKIKKCTVFVADITYVHQSASKRYIPNPNVMIEYGWALSIRSTANILNVMNTANGGDPIFDRPFDMRHLRAPITYCLKDNATQDEIKVQKKLLSDELFKQLRLIFLNIKKESENEPENALRPTTHIHLQEKNPPSSFLSTGEHICSRRHFPGEEKHDYIWQNNAQIFVRVIPIYEQEELTGSKLKALISQNQLPPMGQVTGFMHEMNEWGAVSIEHSSQGQVIIHMAQVTEHKEIWAIDGGTIARGRVFPNIEEYFMPWINLYVNFAFKNLLVDGPVDVIVGMTGIKGLEVIRPRPQPGFSYNWPNNGIGGNARKDALSYKVRIPEADMDLTSLFIPFFKKAWDLFGIDRTTLENVVLLGQ